MPDVKMVETEGEFDGELKSAGNKLVIVDFYATWCGPCKMISPKIEAMTGEFTDCVFLKIDVDENSEVAERYEISAMPTFLFFKKCNKIDEFVGASEDKVREHIVKNKDK